MGRDLTNNQYDWKSVGSYIDGEIVDVSPEFNKEYEKKGQAGDCQRKECGLNQIKIPDTDDQCCWHCIECGDFKYKGFWFTFYDFTESAVCLYFFIFTFQCPNTNVRSVPWGIEVNEMIRHIFASKLKL